MYQLGRKIRACCCKATHLRNAIGNKNARMVLVQILRWLVSDTYIALLFTLATVLVASIIIWRNLQSARSQREETDNYIPNLPIPEDVDHVPLVYTRHSVDEMRRRAKDFYALMQKRRTVRFFSDEDVPVDVVDEIVRTAGTSPSGAHKQPWTFVVVRNRETKRRIREIVEREEEINYARRMGSAWVDALKPLQTTWEKPYLETAPCVVLVFKQVYGLESSGARQNFYYQEISVSIACGFLIAAIHNAGLVTVTHTPLNAGGALRDLLDRPPNEKLLMMLPIGYPADDATVPDFERKELEEILVRID